MKNKEIQIILKGTKMAYEQEILNKITADFLSETMESRRWWNSVPGTQILSTRIQQSYLLKMKLKYFADYKNLETLLLAGLPYKIAKGSSLGWKKASVPRWKFGSTWTNSTSNSNHVMSKESVWTYFLSSFFLKADLKSNCLI